MNDAANESRVASHDDYITPVEAFANFYNHLVNCDRDRDLVIVEVNDEIVGYARTAWFDEAGGARIHELICFLRPTWRRRGIDRAMLATVEERARQVAGSLPPNPDSRFQVDAEDRDVAAGILFGEFGFQAVRHGYSMVRPNLDPQPDAPMPPGLEIREVEPEHLRAIFDAATEAFRDSWSHSEPTEEDYQLFLTDPVESADPSIWRVAWDGDRVAGQVRGFINHEENERFGIKRGWVESISVRRPWRKRGLARALIDATFTVLRERGMTEGALGVDTENPSGALRLYESVGFRPVGHSTTYRKPFGSASVQPPSG